MQETNQTFGLYVHVPFCASRCGYCDFNTYTPGELGTSASPESYLQALAVELELAAQDPRVASRPIDTMFVGGGTPSMLGADGLRTLMHHVRQVFEFAPGAEVTTESNPESTSPAFFDALLEAGFTRISLGMQSAAPHVLQMLQRRHTPGRAVAAAREAKAAGFAHVNLDMIYGTPTEQDADVQATLDAVLGAGVDHVSAYSLIVEDGTAMARKVRQGVVEVVDEDVVAHRYEMIDSALRAAGFGWYEVSNWALPGGECAHNLGYWRQGDWWGAGPGAHSALGAQRFALKKHPARYADSLAQGVLPIDFSETLDEQALLLERLMLGLRLAEGLPRELVCSSAAVVDVVDGHVRRGLLRVSDDGQRLAVTDAGRLLADGIISDICAAL